MSVKIWIGKDYENTGESRMVADVVRLLREAFDTLDSEYHVLCNFEIPGFPSRNKRKYMASLDMAILSPRHFVILELKNYKGILSCGNDGPWHCKNDKNEVVEIKAE